jgi:hypothetical protein
LDVHLHACLDVLPAKMLTALPAKMLARDG